MTYSLPPANALRKPTFEPALIVLLVLAMYLIPGRVPLLPISSHGLLLLPLLFIAAVLHTRRLLLPGTWPYWALLAVLFVSGLVAGQVGPDVFRPVLFGLLTTIALIAVGRRADLDVLFWLLLPILVIDASLGMLMRFWSDAPQWLLDFYSGPMGRPLHRGAFHLLGMLAVGAVYLRTGRAWLLLPFTILVMAVIVTALRGLWVGGAAGIAAMVLLDRRVRSIVLLALAAASFLAVQQGIGRQVERTGELALAIGSGRPLPQTESAPQPQQPVPEQPLPQQPPPGVQKPAPQRGTAARPAPRVRQPRVQPPAPPQPTSPRPEAQEPGGTQPMPQAPSAPSQAEVQAATFALDFSLKSGTAKFREELTPAGRLGYWQAGARMAWAYPVLGVGPGNFPREFPRYYRGVRRDAEPTSDPHSMYFAVLAELGFVGAMALLLILLAAARLVWRHRQSLSARPDLVFAAAAVVALCAVGVTWDIHVQRVWWMTLGLLGIAASDAHAEPDPA